MGPNSKEASIDFANPWESRTEESLLATVKPTAKWNGPSGPSRKRSVGD